MGVFRTGQPAGTWISTAGEATLTIKKEVGRGYSDPLKAQQALVKTGEQGVITREGTQYHAYTIDDGAYLDDLNAGERITGKAANVLDFVGDEGATVAAGQQLYPPTGADNGKVFRVFQAYPSSLDRVTMAAPDRFFISDDIEKLQALGYTVVLDYNTDKSEMINALYDSRTAGFLFSGHGGGGYLGMADDQALGPQDIDPQRVSSQLKMAVFESCQTGRKQAEWEKALKGADVTAWNDNVTNGAMQYFNMRSSSPDTRALDTLIDKHLGGEFARTRFEP
jgi:hypothetical protein